MKNFGICKAFMENFKINMNWLLKLNFLLYMYIEHVGRPLKTDL